MSKNLSALLIKSKNSGIETGVRACVRVMPVAVYNTMLREEPEMDYKHMGDISAGIVEDMLRIMSNGTEDTFSEEIEHAIDFVCGRMEIDPVKIMQTKKGQEK